MRKTTMAEKMMKIIVSTGVAVMVSAFGISGAIASEVTGTFSTGGAVVADNSSNSSSGAGNISGTVIGGADASLQSSGGSGSGGQVFAARSGGNSRGGATGGGSSASQPDTIIITQQNEPAGTPASDADLTGTGGGYDSDLDSYLASLNQSADTGISSSNAISASDAVAYNGGVNPNALTNVAGAAAASTTGKVMTMILIGLAVLGLAGYAVNSYMGYRKERGL